MRKSGTACFDIALAVAAMLLFTPFTVSASNAVSHTPTSAKHGVDSDHHVTVLANTLGQHDSPADQPLHCHLKSPHPQETGPNLSVVDGDLPQLTSDSIFATAQNSETPSLVARAGIPAPIPPRFILFGNFRS